MNLYFKNKNLKIEDIEIFNCYINNCLDKFKKLLINDFKDLSNCKSKDKYKYYFVFKNYDFLKNHIKNLCILKEGLSCSSDKANYIINIYLHYIVTGEILYTDYKIDKFYIPNFGDGELWINYCNSLYRLYLGFSKEYFLSYNALIQSEVRKFKHILHKWYIQLKNGTVIEFEQKWDEDIENPLNEYFDKGDFYIINKSKIQNDKFNFEVYEPIDEREKNLFFVNNFVKIYKSEIKRIYKKSEEVFV